MLRMMLLSAVLTLGVAKQSQAVEAAPNPPPDNKTALAIELLNVTNFDQMVASMQSQVGATLKQQYAASAACSDAQPVLDEFAAAVSQKIAGVLSSQDFKADVAATYTETFSEAELHEIIDFYRTPLGQKWLAHMPELMQKSVQISQARMQPIMPDIQALSEQYGPRIADAAKTCQSSDAAPPKKKSH